MGGGDEWGAREPEGYGEAERRGLCWLTYDIFLLV